MDMFYSGHKVSIEPTNYGFIKVTNMNESILVQRKTQWQGVVYDDTLKVQEEIRQNIDKTVKPNIMQLPVYK